MAARGNSAVVAGVTAKHDQEEKNHLKIFKYIYIYVFFLAMDIL